MKPPFRKQIIEWVLHAWSQLSKESIINSFKCSDLNLANDGIKDDFIHCLKKGTALRSWNAKADSQLSILVDESDVVNPLNSPSDEEYANEEMNMIEDETDEEIVT